MEEPSANYEKNLLGQPSQDSEAEVISSQVKSHLAAQKPDEQDPEANARIRNDSIIECNFYAIKDIEARILHVDILRFQKVSQFLTALHSPDSLPTTFCTLNSTIWQ